MLLPYSHTAVSHGCVTLGECLLFLLVLSVMPTSTCTVSNLQRLNQLVNLLRRLLQLLKQLVCWGEALSSSCRCEAPADPTAEGEREGLRQGVGLGQTVLTLCVTCGGVMSRCVFLCGGIRSSTWQH